MILLFPTLINWESPEDRKNFDIRSDFVRLDGILLLLMRGSADTFGGGFFSCHMFYQRRVVDIPDGKPKWTGINNQSELIEDSPPELMKKRKRDIEEEEGNKKNSNGS